MVNRTITLIIDSAHGVLVRTIADASPLPEGARGGSASEEAVRNAAALWGLPDFLFRAEIIAKGKGSREIGDNLLIVGDLGLVVQSKRREAFPAHEDRERSWALKAAKTALDQADGTIRTLLAESYRLSNRRGRVLDIDGSSLRWLSVAVLDHPDPPRDIVPKTIGRAQPAVVLLRRDWEFLFDQLKSSHAVGRYLSRVSEIEEDWELGAEASRYFQLAQADAHAKPGQLDRRVFGGHGQPLSAPLLPLEPAASGEGERPHRLLRAILEDVAVSRVDGLTEETRLHVLASLDRLEVGHRAAVGNYLLDAMELVSKEPPGGEVLWPRRNLMGRPDDPRPVYLSYGACSHPWGKPIDTAFTSWVALRHHQMGEALARVAELTSVGVLMTPRHDGVRDWDSNVIMTVGDLGLGSDWIEHHERLWPFPGTSD